MHAVRRVDLQTVLKYRPRAHFRLTRTTRSRVFRASSVEGTKKRKEGIGRLEDAPLIAFRNVNAKHLEIPSGPGVYAVYDANKDLQYIGLSWKVIASINLHMHELPQLCDSVRYAAVPTPSKAALQNAWKQWMSEHINENAGNLPPGNAQGNSLWAERKLSPVKDSFVLTDGVAECVNDDEIIKLCRKLVSSSRIVVFIKGSRENPECGFSHRVCMIMDELRVEYETVDTLDEVHNHNLRNVLKRFSDWPTIPQVYFNGVFLGGHDIIEEMHNSGELKSILME